VTRSARASRAFVTVRSKDAPPESLADGVVMRTLYQAITAQLRPGEPRRVRIVELAPGARWRADVAAADRSEWLVMRGELIVAGQALGARDFHHRPTGAGVCEVSSVQGASFYLREAPTRGGAPQQANSVLDAQAGWQDYAPGIKRRVMWTQDGEAALLYHALPGAQVPRHGHGHDEECLMLDGDVFLDDVLLRPGDYQLAPAGTLHGGVSTDTGLVLFAHGDLDMDIRAE
ncbi:MAG: cupin domain-containing protein, partial [Burkholderiales bacterium]|nr:cupin domain-containing protein [Burkholderiales bacterium]